MGKGYKELCRLYRGQVDSETGYIFNKVFKSTIHLQDWAEERSEDVGVELRIQKLLHFSFCASGLEMS